MAGIGHRIAAVAACIVLLSGCRSSEDRINEAFPVSEGVTASKAKVEKLLAVNGGDLAKFNSEYTGKQKMRALSCAPGFEPSFLQSADSIRTELNKAECFANFDTEQTEWLKLRRAALLLGVRFA